MNITPAIHRTPIAFLSFNFYLSDDNSTDNDYSIAASSITEGEKKRRVLIVDDVLDVTAVLSAFLTHAGFDVVTTDSAPSALNVALEQQFDLIVSDIGMPSMTGYDLAKVLRAIPRYEAVPMLAVTGYSMFDDREAAIKAGFTAFMTKPIDFTSLLDLIEHL
jgi:two-component system, chemotaxis family, CheB/CheR fusion protein